MGGFTIWHFAIVLVIWAAWVIPLYKIFGRIGWARGLAFIALIPPLAVVLLWCIAFGRWGAVEEYRR